MSKMYFQAPVSLQAGSSIALIPVGLREAALDSPTFRSAFVHYSEQLDFVEKWLEDYTKSITKLSREIGSFESLINGFLLQTIPPSFLSEAILDHDYTLLAMKQYSEGTTEFWSNTIQGIRRMESNIGEPIRTFLQNDVRNFKETRRSLEQSQKQFENLLARYTAQTKNKEPSLLREDAFQLHESRKAYLKASMDFGETAPQLRVTLDKLMIRVFSDQWLDMRNRREQNGGLTDKCGMDVERLRGWSRELEKGEKVFRRELRIARKQIEERAELAVRPSRDLEDYSLTTIFSAGFRGPTSTSLPMPSKLGLVSSGKQGWLNIRTITGKPSKIVWVRRWFYVKNGIFGWLVQGSTSGGVEESERIGVLLCSVRALTEEEHRHYCFEVKTKDISTLLQAETQLELIEWMTSFEMAKQKALEDSTTINTAIPRAQDAAFAISPPYAPEFSASAADLGVQQLSDDNPGASFDRSGTLPLPGGESSLNLVNRSSFDVNGHRRPFAAEKDNDSLREHGSRILQKLDLHRKSAGGPPGSGGIPSPSLSNTNLAAGGGIASLIAASHNVMPVGPPTLTPAIPKFKLSTRPTLRELPLSSLAPDTLANPPASTNLSSNAVMVNCERGVGVGDIRTANAMSSSIMANIWGSSNWGILNKLVRGEVRPPIEGPQDFSDPSNTQSQSVESSVKASEPAFDSNKVPDSVETAHSAAKAATRSLSTRPDVDVENDKAPEPQLNLAHDVSASYYPLQLKIQDAQFRLIFPNIAQEEKLVYVFRATLSLNDQQEFPGRVYVTATNMYIYSNHVGLVMISELALDSIIGITATSRRESDILFLHLVETDKNTGLRCLILKTFLEPLNLLQRRLKYLIQNSRSHEAIDLESVMKGLINVAKADSAGSLSLGSYDDIPTNTLTDNGLLKWSFSQRDHSQLQAKVIADSGFPGTTEKPDEGKGAAKVKRVLPPQSVDYVPDGMDRLAVEQIFDISPKSLFHIMFGDKSAIWQLLYHKSHAQRVKQGSWHQLEGSHLRLRREFEYEVEYQDLLGRRHRRTVIDSQMCETTSSHLLYVVADRKTPWYLPYHQNFLLLSKIVISHYAKSKCKLAVYTKVDWILNKGYARGIVARRGLEDLELAALELVDLIRNQVKKLEGQGHTNEITKIFGAIGQQTQISEFTGTDAPLIRESRRRVVQRSTLTGLFLASLGLRLGNSVMSSITCVLSLILSIPRMIGAHSILSSLFAISLCINIIFSSTTTSDWWKEQRAGEFMTRIGVGPNFSMSKAIYLRDLNDVIDGEIGEFEIPGNTCYETYQKMASLTDMDVAYDRVQASLLGMSGMMTARRVRRTRQRMGFHRHNLLVALRVVNSIEREMMQAEWETWRMNENANCQHLRIMVGQNKSRPFRHHERDRQGQSEDRHHYDEETLARYEAYCDSCSDERNRQL